MENEKRETRRTGDEHFAEQVSQVCEKPDFEKENAGGTQGSLWKGGYSNALSGCIAEGISIQ